MIDVVVSKLKRKIIVKNINHIITVFFAKKYDLIHVVEYPKCGATWVSRLIATYINVDRKFGNSHVLKYNSVIQKHVLFNPFYNKVVIVARDPRDVLVSFYFHELYHDKNNKKTRNRIGFKDDCDDKANFITYVKYKLSNPSETSPGFSYNKFIDSWLVKEHAKHFHIVYYEDLQNNTYRELKNIIKFLGFKVFPDRLEKAIEEHSFVNISGREKGQEDKYSHKRKGIVGDWKNYFNPELHDFVKEHQSGLFEKLGYELDN